MLWLAAALLGGVVFFVAKVLIGHVLISVGLGPWLRRRRERKRNETKAKELGKL